MDLIPGRYSKWIKNWNAKRLYNSSYNNFKSSKLHRKIIRGRAKQKVKRR